MRVTVLGSGTSMGVPVIGCDCRVCTSDDPHDKRTRTAALIEQGGATILIDTPPELRLQLVSAGVARVDAVLYTHEHADHVHGIDDLRTLSGRSGPIPVFGSAEAIEAIRRRFPYIFDGKEVPDGTTKPQMDLSVLTPDEEVTIAGIGVLPLRLDHGVMDVLGFRFGQAAYLTDVKSIPPQAMRLLAGIDVLVINALFDRPHPTHLSIPQAVAIAGELGVERTYITHLTHRYTHADLSDRLPEGIEPAYDGLCIEL